MILPLPGERAGARADVIHIHALVAASEKSGFTPCHSLKYRRIISGGCLARIDV